MHKMKGQ